MYIDTSTKESIESSVLRLLEINGDKLSSLLEDGYQKFQVDKQIFMLDEQYDFFFLYVKEHMKTVLDEVMFIHLSRRIDNGDNNGYGLIEVLTKENSLSSFLRTYGITFKYEDNQLKIYVNDQEVHIDDEDSYGYKNLQQKINLGYDLEFSGYLLKDKIEMIREYDMHSEGAEIFSILYLFNVDDDLIIDTFTEKSDFYQLEYVLPLKDVVFDNYDDLDEQDKQYHVVVTALQRLYNYKYDEDFISDDCPVMHMKDNQTLDAKYLINKIKIDD